VTTSSTHASPTQPGAASARSMASYAAWAEASGTAMVDPSALAIRPGGGGCDGSAPSRRNRRSRYAWYGAENVAFSRS